jgi:hypothetical protein
MATLCDVATSVGAGRSGERDRSNIDDVQIDTECCGGMLGKL